MAGSRIPCTGQINYSNDPFGDNHHGIAHRASFCSRMPLGMGDDVQERLQNRANTEINRLNRELTKALKEILAEVRADAQRKDKILDQSSIFEQALIYLGAAIDGTWESIEGYGETLFDTALFFARRIDPLTGHQTLREDLKNMKSFVHMTRDKIAHLDMTDEDLILFYLVITDSEIYEQLLRFSQAYVKSLSSVDQVRLAASLLPDLLLVFVTAGLILPITGISKTRHLQKIQPILRKMGSVLRDAFYRRKTQRRNFGGGPGDGSSGHSLSSPASSAAENKLPPPRRGRGKPDDTKDNDDKIDDGVKDAKPKVTAEATVDGATFKDTNQTARPKNQADADQPTLISERISAKEAKKGKELPNGNMATAHAEIGSIQQAANAGKTKGADMSMTVKGKDVCGFCKGDVAAAAEKAELKSLTIKATDDATGLPKTYNWKPGMKSIKEKP